jgi:hypothetical protein
LYGQTGRGNRYPQAIRLHNLLAILAALPSGYTELGCHPSAADVLVRIMPSADANCVRSASRSSALCCKSSTSRYIHSTI